MLDKSTSLGNDSGKNKYNSNEEDIGGFCDEYKLHNALLYC